MKLEILGVEYDYARAMNKAQLVDLYDLKLASGIGVRSIKAALFSMADAALAGREVALENAEQPEILLAVQALVFLCRRYAGEAVTYKEASVSYDDLLWIPEDADIPDEPDPPVASGDQTPLSPETVSEPSSSEPKPSKTKSKTSKSPSTATS